MNTYDIDDLVIFGAFVSLEVVGKLSSIFGDVRALGGVQVVHHALVKGEDGGCCSNFGTHVTDRGHASAREGFDSRTFILDDGTSTTFDGKNASNLENDI